jgi:glycerol-3-phosphate dehydrogenase (NAD(P)+)
MKDIIVLGAGAWGTALAMQAAKSGVDVTIWSRKPEIVHSINAHHRNPTHLSNLALPRNIKASSNLESILDYKHILLAIPAQSTRLTLSPIPFSGKHSFIICSKGLETNSLKLLSEVVEDIAPKSQIAILSGPNFAREVAEGLPATTSIASRDKGHLEEVTNLFAGRNFVVHCNDDIIGTQICGAAKNVVAIACGICLGAGLGENAKAAILTKGLSEISQLIRALGGRQETILSPAGVGDFSLTCGSPTSRNMLYGIDLASGKHKGDKLVEGFHAARSIGALAQKHGLKLELIEALGRAIDNPSSASKEIYELFCLKV